MTGPAPRPDQDHSLLVERLIAGLLLALYAVLVSRGEFLPLPDGLRALAAPLLGLSSAGLLVWRLWPWLADPRLVRAARHWLPLVALLVGAAGLRLAVVPVGRPVGADELAVLVYALQVINNDPLDAPLTVAALGWLHAPLAALRYVAGVSNGLWQFLRSVSPEHLLAWSRLLHLLLGLGTLASLAVIGGRLASVRAGFLAALLLALAGPSIVASLTIDWGLPLAVVTTALITLLAVRRPGALAGAAWPPPARWAAVALGLTLLWLPGPGVALAPLGALLAGRGLADWWPARRA